jgi:hypothetical protein
MPHSPKPLKSIIIENTSIDIIYDFYPIQIAPNLGPSPNINKLIPYKN